uniref:Mitochondrial inner membrane protein OXA1L n=1 Tax=Pogona vitticeps TaxID=103695 RepID=A0A6J0V4C6_9SAUR
MVAADTSRLRGTSARMLDAPPDQHVVCSRADAFGAGLFGGPRMMAALVVGGCAWNRVGVTAAKPLLRNFVRKSHKTFDPLTWRRAKPPFLLRLDPPNGCRLPLFRPAIRYQSTAAVAGMQVAQPPTPPPIENLLSTEDLGQAVQELSFAEMGMNCTTPVGLIQNLLEVLHVNVGLPWWGAIITGTVVARCLVFPLIVKGQQEAAKLNKHMPQINQLTARMNEAKRSTNKFEYAKAYSDLMVYQKTHNINPLRGFMVPLVQMPIFISFYFALRKMAELPVPSLQTGGFWWITDLTAADPYYILPLTVTATMWVVLELGAESGVSNPNMQTMKMFFRVIPLVILPVTMSFPTAIFLYWVTSNLFSLVQLAVLRVPAIRTRLRIERPPQQNTGPQEPQESFISSIKKGWTNIQLAHQLDERNRRIKEQLEMAARGPLRQTFRHNPLEQQPRPAPKPPQKKRPWEDTLG